MRTRPGRVLACAALLALGARPVPSDVAAAPADGLQPAFPAQARIAWVDASAVDERERPVASLAGEDFEILEDGRPRSLLAFRAPAPAGAIVVLVEDLLLRPPQLAGVRDAVRRLAQGARPGDSVLLAAASGLSASSAPPAGTAGLLAELGKLRSDRERLASLREGAEWKRLNARRLEALVAALEALPGEEGSRALVVIGPPLPVEVEDASGRAAHERVMRASQRAAAAVHFLSSGEDPLFVKVPEARWPDASGGVARATPLLPTTRPSGVPAAARLYESVAADTGGVSAPSAAGWDAAVDRILWRSQARYLLGIAAAEDASAGGGFHPVEVRALRAGVRVHARRGYFAP